MMAYPGLFITATDTAVGKTWFACALLKKLAFEKIARRVYKPVESACVQSNGQCHPRDAEQLLHHAQNQQTLEQVCPYRLKASVSPARAAALEKISFDITDLAEVCHLSKQWFSLVEGAGGFYSPLTQKQLNADLAQKLAIPLLVLVPNRLGCISQALLVVEAARRRKLKVQALVLNTLPSSSGHDKDESIASNAQELGELVDVPVLTTNDNEQHNDQTLIRLYAHLHKPHGL